jgi:hypothetical protein
MPSLFEQLDLSSLTDLFLNLQEKNKIVFGLLIESLANGRHNPVRAAP